MIPERITVVRCTKDPVSLYARSGVQPPCFTTTVQVQTAWRRPGNSTLRNELMPRCLHGCHLRTTTISVAISPQSHINDAEQSDDAECRLFDILLPGGPIKRTCQVHEVRRSESVIGCGANWCWKTGSRKWRRLEASLLRVKSYASHGRSLLTSCCKIRYVSACH